MLQKMMQDLQGDTIVAQDGAFGSVKDAYFDDARWAVRYLVVDTGKWLPGRKVLISPISVAHEETNDKTIRVNLSRKQVERAPGTVIRSIGAAPICGAPQRCRSPRRVCHARS
jgi:hypothetical protein